MQIRRSYISSTCIFIKHHHPFHLPCHAHTHESRGEQNTHAPQPISRGRTSARHTGSHGVCISSLVLFEHVVSKELCVASRSKNIAHRPVFTDHQIACQTYVISVSGLLLAGDERRTILTITICPCTSDRCSVSPY